MNIIRFWIVMLLFLIMAGQTHTVAQSYLHTRFGLGWGRYAPYNKAELDHNEHYVKLGIITDVEYGRKFGLNSSNEKFSLLIGARLHYNLRLIEGIYTANRWEPDTRINAHIFGVYATPGISMKVSNKFSIFLQANVGATFILWYQEGVYMDSFWVFYLPVDIGAEYKLKEKLSLTFGINVQIPIYTGTAETLFIGIKKEF